MSGAGGMRGRGVRFLGNSGKVALYVARFWHSAALWGGTVLALYGTLSDTIVCEM